MPDLVENRKFSINPKLSRMKVNIQVNGRLRINIALQGQLNDIAFFSIQNWTGRLAVAGKHNSPATTI